MLSTNQSKYLLALQVKKYRQKYHKFIIEGEKMVAELLQQDQIGVQALFGIERWAAENEPLLRPFLEKINIVSEQELKKISTLSTPNKVLAVADMPVETIDIQSLAQDFHFYLDGLQDPGNLGTIFRIADWFGMPSVICSPETVDAFGPKVVQSSMGAIFRIKTVEMPLAEIMAQLPALPVLGAVMNGNNVFTADLPKHGLLVIGNEGRGISPEIQALLTHRLTIPKSPKGGAESLNASVAAGILAARLF